MRRLIFISVFCMMSLSSTTVLAVALYINGSNQIRLLDNDTKPTSISAKQWKLIKSGDELTIELNELIRLVRIEARQTSMGDGSSIRTQFDSGLLFMTNGAIRDPDYNKSDKDREIGVAVVLINTYGGESVRVSDKDFTVKDSGGNEYSVKPCQSANRRVPSTQYLKVGETYSTTMCAEIPGRLNRDSLRIGYDDGNGEVRWVKVR